MTGNSGTDLSPLSWLWSPRVIVWLVLAGQGLAVLFAFSPQLQASVWIRFGLASLAIQWTLVITLLVVFIARGPLHSWNADRLGWFAVGALLASTGVVSALMWKFAPWPTMMTGVSVFEAVGKSLLVALTVGLFALAGLQWFHRSRSLEAKAKDARLEALQARIRPHFLFNTLNTGAALVHEKPEAAEDLLLDLADLFRAALSGPELINLADELDLARRYLHIEQLRFGDRLRVRWEVPDILPDVKLPALSLQPLVENAVHHGVDPCPEGGELLMQVAVGRRTVQVLVQNAVARHAPRQRNGHSIGLASVRARIEALSEGRARLEVQPGEDVYRVSIVVPLD